MMSEPLQRYVDTGDPEAFREMVTRYQGMVYGTCRRVLGDAEDVKDAVQDTFLKLAQRAREIRSANPGAWLHVCARSTALNVLEAKRARRRREAPLNEERIAQARAQASDEIEASENAAIVDECLDELPEDDRDVVISYFFVDRSQAEIAQRTGVSQSAVQKRIDRALQSLRQRIVRRGLAVSGALAAFLTDLGAVQVPDSLSRQLANLDPTSPATDGSAALTKASGVGGLKIAAVAASIVLASAAATLLQTRKPADQSGAIDPQHRREWLFNGPGTDSGLRPVAGAWSWSESNLLRSDSDEIRADIDYPTSRLPLLVSIYAKPEAPAGDQEILCTVRWAEPERAVRFFNVGSPVELLPGSYGLAQIYVTEHAIDSWCNRQRVNLQAVEHKPGGGLQLTLRGRCTIAWINIQEISPQQLPADLSRCLDALAAIPTDRRRGRMMLPELKSARPGQQVWVDFLDGAASPP